ncbi:MAG: ribosome-associated translation inhibitor RaiA [Helcococcus sp.]|nr:ribosome-associated translation inhibitor RaiA [Helcococcus sp.]
MRIEYVGKNITIRDNFKEDVEKKLSRLDRYFDDDVEARATFSSYGNFKTVEVTIWLKKGTILRAEETTDDMLSSVDRVIDALDKQIRKYKTKLQTRKTGESIRFEEVPHDETTIQEGAKEKVVKYKKIGLKPMFIEDAIMQMNLLNHDFFVYEDAETSKIAVVYKRKDGDFGVIEQE